MALKVTVKKSRWSQDDYYGESDQIGVNISDSGVLTVSMKEQTRSYGPGSWRTITSKTVSSRSMV